MYCEYKRRGNESYLQARQLFLSNESFQRWAVDDPETSEMFPLNIATSATLEGRQTVSTGDRQEEIID
jgi:hypothetical protein